MVFILFLNRSGFTSTPTENKKLAALSFSFSLMIMILFTHNCLHTLSLIHLLRCVVLLKTDIMRLFLTINGVIVWNNCNTNIRISYVSKLKYFLSSSVIVMYCNSVRTHFENGQGLQTSQLVSFSCRPGRPQSGPAEAAIGALRLRRSWSYSLQQKNVRKTWNLCYLTYSRNVFLRY